MDRREIKCVGYDIVKQMVDDMAKRYDSKTADAQQTARMARHSCEKLKEEFRTLKTMTIDSINVSHDARKCIEEIKQENKDFKKSFFRLQYIGLPTLLAILLGLIKLLEKYL